MLGLFKRIDNRGPAHCPNLSYNFTIMAINCVAPDKLNSHWCPYHHYNQGDPKLKIATQLSLSSSFKIKEVPREDLPLYIGSETTGLFLKKLSGIE